MVRGERSEIVVGINFILNMPLKWWHRLTAYNPIRPETRVVQGVKNFIQWEVHPLWRVFFWDVLQNRKSFGSGVHVYDPNAHWIKQTAQAAIYMFGQCFRFYGTLMDAAETGNITEKEKKEQDKILDAGLTQLDKVLFTVFGYKYTRSNLEERRSIMKKYLDKEYTSRQYEIKRKYEGAKRTKKLTELKKWRQKCKTWIMEEMK